MVHRVTGLATYRECPRLYKKRIDGEDGPPTMPMRIGSAAHDVVGEYITWCRNAKIATDYAIVPRLVHDAIDRSDLPPSTEDELLGICERFARSHIAPLTSRLRIECEIALDDIGRLCSGDDPAASILGHPDYVELRAARGRITVIDWKSGYQTRPDWFQLRAYAFLVSRTLSSWFEGELEAIELIYDYIRWGVAKAQVLTPDDLPAIGEQLRALMNKVESDERFAPTPGERCKTCRSVRGCKPGGEITEGIPTGQMEAEALAEMWLVGEAANEQIKEQLRSWICAEGVNLVVHGAEIGYFRQGGRRWPNTTAFRNACDGKEINWIEYLKVDNAKVRKELFTEDGECPEWLRNIGEPGERLPFGRRKAGPEYTG